MKITPRPSTLIRRSYPSKNEELKVQYKPYTLPRPWNLRSRSGMITGKEPKNNK